ncbi:hypothetical protein ANSO36C_48920 [Nostoc cf. commune SO-36]|uniref:Transposase n=1 Tax=Nostoc cf. commune SO-36 TaxID=449208 RepID=A0ABN6QA28_NOSCO|nr:hypothetical protein ANSO36C_48920 [Nostoc cf. commune SO-36]
MLIVTQGCTSPFISVTGTANSTSSSFWLRSLVVELCPKLSQLKTYKETGKDLAVRAQRISSYTQKGRRNGVVG